MKIRDMRNMGPKSEAMLVRAGIRNIGQLRQLGAVEAAADMIQSE